MPLVKICGLRDVASALVARTPSSRAIAFEFEIRFPNQNSAAPSAR